MAELPKHYHLKSEEKDHFVLHDSRDKKEFKVAKKGIHPAHQLDILRLPRYSEGGDVSKEDVPDYIKNTLKNSKEEPVIGSWGRMDDNKNSVDDTLKTIGLGEDPAQQARYEEEAKQHAALSPLSKPIDMNPEVATAAMPQAQEAPPAPVAQAPDQASAQAAAFQKLDSAPVAQPQAQPQAAPRGMASMIDPQTGLPSLQGMAQAQNSYEGAIQAGARGEMALNQEQARMMGQHAAFQQLALQEQQEWNRAKFAQLEKLSGDIAKKEIDPNRYWNSRDSGAKMRAGIGIMLSGLSGASHNMAMDVIQKNIDRDIDSQKANLGKKQTLFSDNLRLLGEKTSAENATRAQYEAIFQGQLAQMAAKMGNPMIQAKAAALIQESRMKQMQLMQPVAQAAVSMNIKTALQQAHQAGQGLAIEPASLIPRLVPEAHQKEAFAEVKRAQDTRHGMQFGMKAFDDMVNELKTVKGAVTSPEAQTRLESAILPTVQDLEGSVRQAAMDYAKKAYVPSIQDIALGRVKGKRKALEEYYKSKSSAPTFEGFAGVPLTAFSSTAPIQNQADRLRAWAEKNPKDPRSKQVLEQLKGG